MFFSGQPLILEERKAEGPGESEAVENSLIIITPCPFLLFMWGMWPALRAGEQGKALLVPLGLQHILGPYKNEVDVNYFLSINYFPPTALFYI